MKAIKGAGEAVLQDTPELGVLGDIISFHVRRVHKVLARGFTDRIGEVGAKPGAFTALALISANSGLSQTTLSREMGFDKATIVALIDALEEQGWAVRERAEGDRRRHSLALTRAGEAALKRLQQIALANEAPLREGLSAQELRRLADLLDRAYVCIAGESK